MHFYPFALSLDPFLPKIKYCFVVSNYFECPKSTSISDIKHLLTMYSGCEGDLRRLLDIKLVWQYRVPCWLSRMISKGEGTGKQTNKKTTKQPKKKLESLYKAVCPRDFQSFRKAGKNRKAPLVCGLDNYKGTILTRFLPQNEECFDCISLALLIWQILMDNLEQPKSLF